MTFTLTLRILRVLCLKGVSCLCFRWEMFSPDGGSEGRAEEAEITVESRKELQPVNAQKERRFPITVNLFTLYKTPKQEVSILCFTL